MLLLDARLIHETRNARLAVVTVDKHVGNPLFGEDQKWEVHYDNLYPNVLWDQMQQRYRCWYNLFLVDPHTTETPRDQRLGIKYDSNRPREHGICYAESEDGLRWTKPQLGLVDFAGSTANNILMRGACGAGVLIEPHDPRSERRYKMMYGGVWNGEYQSNTTVHFSSDGIHWGEPIRCKAVKAENPSTSGTSVRWLVGLCSCNSSCRMPGFTLSISGIDHADGANVAKRFACECPLSTVVAPLIESPS